MVHHHQIGVLFHDDHYDHHRLMHHQFVWHPFLCHSVNWQSAKMNWPNDGVSAPNRIQQSPMLSPILSVSPPAKRMSMLAIHLNTRRPVEFRYVQFHGLPNRNPNSNKKKKHPKLSTKINFYL